MEVQKKKIRRSGHLAEGVVTNLGEMSLSSVTSQRANVISAKEVKFPEFTVRTKTPFILRPAAMKFVTSW